MTWHQDLEGRAFFGDSPQCSVPTPHATNTAGTIAGDGTIDASYAGMARRATVISYCFDKALSPDIDRYSDIALALSRGVMGEDAAYTVQAATLITFCASSYWIVARYPTPIAVNAQLRRD